MLPQCSKHGVLVLPQCNKHGTWCSHSVANMAHGVVNVADMAHGVATV